jgi:hypothetical protein
MAGVRFRPWLQAFKDYAFDRRVFTDKEIRAQIQASDAVRAGGWLLWNAGNHYTTAGLSLKSTTAAQASAKPIGNASPVTR